MEKTHNILRDIHMIWTEAPIVFRDEVCKECGYSTPTYYRKKQPRKAKRGAPKDELSRAEKKAIWEQSDKLLSNLRNRLDALRKHIH